MKNNKSRIWVFVVAMALALTAMAQQRGSMSVAGNYAYATKHKQHGFALKFAYEINDHFRLEPEMMYFATNHDASTLDLTLNVHYLFPIVEHLRAYPTAGINYSHWTYEGPDESRVGVVLGGGAEYWISASWAIMFEQRFQLVSHESQSLTSLGVRYSF